MLNTSQSTPDMVCDFSIIRKSANEFIKIYSLPHQHYTIFIFYTQFSQISGAQKSVKTNSRFLHFFRAGNSRILNTNCILIIKLYQKENPAIRRGEKTLYDYSASHCFSQRAETASDGIRQSPRGDSVTVPTFGPSGRQERLNCWAKNLL